MLNTSMTIVSSRFISVHVTLLKCIHRDGNKDGEKTRFSKTPNTNNVIQHLS